MVEQDSGGYDYKFIEEPPDSLKCLICLLVAKDLQQHGGCGKLFCKTCIARYTIQKDDCPHCRQALSKGLQTSIFNDFRSDQEVKSLLIQCSQSCGWQGELRALDDHLKKDCENALVPCPNMCNKGGIKILRKNLINHLIHKCPRRKQACTNCEELVEYQLLTDHNRNKCPKRQYQCPHCNETGCYDERTTTHLEVCLKFNIQCEKCFCLVLRCDYENHPCTCTHEPVECKYYNIGCMEKPLRKDSKKHEENTQIHLAIATNTVLQLKNALFLKNTITFQMTDFENKRSSNETFYSPHFRTSLSGYKFCIAVRANGNSDGKGTHVSAYVCLTKGDNDDSLTWPFTGTVTIELLNQLEDRNHYKAVFRFLGGDSGKRVVDRLVALMGFGQPRFISHSDLNSKPSINCQYLKEDRLVFRASATASDHKPWLECNT